MTEEYGVLSGKYGPAQLLRVCSSAAGYYIGTIDQEGCPNTRESHEYWSNKEKAREALANKSFTQRQNP